MAKIWFKYKLVSKLHYLCQKHQIV